MIGGVEIESITSFLKMDGDSPEARDSPRAMP